jgi:heptose I phosphotransferase
MQLAGPSRIRPFIFASDPAGTGLVSAGDGAMWIEPGFRTELVAAGLVDFDSVMATTDGHCLRALDERENWRLQLRIAGRPTRAVFLKKHHICTGKTRRWAKRGLRPPDSAGHTEARRVRQLSAIGINVMRLVAWGEKLQPDGLLESFVLTEELKGYTPLDHYLRQRFPQQGSSRSNRRDRDLDRLIRQMAALARRFHRAGYNHRDFYCGHFFIKESEPGEFQIKMIDLQRVQHRRRFRRRWLIKDLAQLSWSAVPDRVKCTQRLAFMRYYLGVDKLRPEDKRLIREVLAKQQAMTQRLGMGP